MEKAIESDITITNVVNDEVAVVGVNEVPVVDVPVVNVAGAVVVDGVVDANVVVFEVEQVQGEVR